MKDKSVMIAIQPYWVFIIIARKMGWQIDKEKTIEVRKSFPKDESWNRKAEIYCSKDKKSFNLIPKEYQLLMKKFLGKVIGHFTCDIVREWKYLNGLNNENEKEYWIVLADVHATCLTYDEIKEYGKGKNLYGWHISDLVIYDKPKELSEFRTPCKMGDYPCCGICDYAVHGMDGDLIDCDTSLTRPPQSWCYYYTWLKDALKEQQKNGRTIWYDSENKAYYLI